MPDFIESIFGSILGGISRFAGVARLLGMVGGVLKSFDSDDRGIDDAAGEVCIAVGRVMSELETGDRGADRVLQSIAGARIGLDALERIYTANLPEPNPGPTDRASFVSEAVAVPDVDHGAGLATT